MLNLSAAAILEKNKLSSDGVWLILLKITLEVGTVIRITRNTEDVIWNGYTWTAFPFELDEITEETGEPSILNARIGNVSRVMQTYMETYDGMVGCGVNLYVVHSDNLSNATAELDEEFEITRSSADNVWATFTLSAPSLLVFSFPSDRYTKNWCRFKFNYPPGESPRCGYSGTTPFTTCNKTLAACRQRGNQARFGGFPGIPEGGIYVTT